MSSCGISVQQNTPCVGRQGEAVKDSEGAEFTAVEEKNPPHVWEGEGSVERVCWRAKHLLHG